jgi:hypothetical protein
MRLNRIFAALCLLGLANCSTVTSGTTQVVSVETTPVIGASCLLSSEKGTWNVPSTPGSTSITRGYGDLNVVCSHPSGAKGATTVASSTEGSAWGNILVGGIIGGAIDMSDGAAYGYPSMIRVQLSSPLSQNGRVQIQCAVQGSIQWMGEGSCLAANGFPMAGVSVSVP